jgi:hypothetical protein
VAAGGLATQMRRPKPHVARRTCRASQEAPGLALAYPKYADAGVGSRQRWIEGPGKLGLVRPPGFMRSKPRNTARGTPDERRTCGHYHLGKP